MLHTYYLSVSINVVIIWKKECVYKHFINYVFLMPTIYSRQAIYANKLNKSDEIIDKRERESKRKWNLLHSVFLFGKDIENWVGKVNKI